MQRPRIWNFHNPRISLAQSCLREVINHATLPSGGASALLARVESVVGGWLGMKPAAVVAPGLAAEHLAMDALGSVLDRIDQGTVTDSGTAIAAYKSIRASQPAVAGDRCGSQSRCLDLVSQFLLAWVLKDQEKENEIKSEFADNTCDPGWLVAVDAWFSHTGTIRSRNTTPQRWRRCPFPFLHAGLPMGSFELGSWGLGNR